MSNYRDIVAQKNCAYGAGIVNVSGNDPLISGDATFDQAFGAGPIDVYYAIEDSSEPKRTMVGSGQLNGGFIDVSSPSMTFDGTTYSNSPGGPIALVNPCIVRCTINGREANAFLQTVAVDGTTITGNGHSVPLAAVNNGDVVGPGSAEDDGVAFFDGTTGKLIKAVVGFKRLQAVWFQLANQFNGLVQKTTPVDDDVLLIEDSQAGGEKKYLRIVNLLAAVPGVTNFLGLTDTPSDYTGHASKTVKVNGTEDGLEFVTDPGIDLTDAVFPTYASFDEQVAAVSAVNFSTGNKQTIAGSAGAVTLTAPGVGTYLLLIADASTITSILGSSGTTTWIGGVPDFSGAGKLVGVGCHYDGTDWTLSGSVEE